MDFLEATGESKEKRSAPALARAAITIFGKINMPIFITIIFSKCLKRSMFLQED